MSTTHAVWAAAVSVLTGVAPGAADPAPARWTAVEQPALKARLDAAPTLTPEGSRTDRPANG
ncbi:MAG: hypothetical protein JXR37_28695 [Kiritimatiellae bacterium]|nr:hypothetical protein [Kiritimatiellia bacterium]